MAVPGFEPGSSGPQPLMLTTTLYHHFGNPIFIKMEAGVVKYFVLHKNTRSEDRTRDLVRVRHA